jgi:hypothetical protein
MLRCVFFVYSITIFSSFCIVPKNGNTSIYGHVSSRILQIETAGIALVETLKEETSRTYKGRYKSLDCSFRSVTLRFVTFSSFS